MPLTTAQPLELSAALMPSKLAGAEKPVAPFALATGIYVDLFEAVPRPASRSRAEGDGVLAGQCDDCDCECAPQCPDCDCN
jgi:hypothetical protein